MCMRIIIFSIIILLNYACKGWALTSVENVPVFRFHISRSVFLQFRLLPKNCQQIKKNYQNFGISDKPLLPLIKQFWGYFLLYFPFLATQPYGNQHNMQAYNTKKMYCSCQACYKMATANFYLVDRTFMCTKHNNFMLKDNNSKETIAMRWISCQTRIHTWSIFLYYNFFLVFFLVSDWACRSNFDLNTVKFKSSSNFVHPIISVTSWREDSFVAQ